MAHGLSSCGSRDPECRLSSCGAWAWLLCSRWDLPGPGIEPVSPALAGGFPTTAPPGKSSHSILNSPFELLLGLNSFFFKIFIYLAVFFFVADVGSFLAVHGLLQHAGFSLVVACGFFLCLVVVRGTWAPGHTGSVVFSTRALLLRHSSSAVVAYGLSCPMAYGILVPQSPVLQGRFFTTGPPGRSLIWS